MSSSRQDRRGGVALLAAIVCVAIMTVMFVAILKTAAVQRRGLRTRGWQLQAEWLAESSLERAAWQLRHDAGYRGETWTVSAEQLGTRRPAAVAIEVDDLPGQPQRRTVRVRADYPNDPQRRARVSKQAVVRLVSSEEEER